MPYLTSAFRLASVIARIVYFGRAETLQLSLGWALGLVFEPSDAAIVPVFLPGAPQWTSGSVVFAERVNIRQRCFIVQLHSILRMKCCGDPLNPPVKLLAGFRSIVAKRPIF